MGVLKAIVIGEKGPPAETDEWRVEYFAWDEVGRILNFSDCSVLLISLLRLKTREQRSAVDWNSWARGLDFRAVHDILEPGGAVVVIGDATFEAEITDLGAPVRVPFLEWTGLRLSWDRRPGNSVASTNQEAARARHYLSHLKRWDYSLRGCQAEFKALQTVYKEKWLLSRDVSVKVNRTTFARNRYGGDLAFSAEIEIREAEINRSFTVARIGPIYFLPEVDLEPHIAVESVLRDLFGIEVHALEPEWVREISVPRQIPIDQRIEAIQSLTAALASELGERIEAREETRRPLRLLYETGTALEEIVRGVLACLGASVEAPTHPGKEDGWIEVEVSGERLSGVLEVKSTRNDAFSEAGLRQIAEWKTRGAIERQKGYKGIFIGCSALANEPRLRVPGYSDSWRKSSELQEIAALRAEDLLAAYILDEARELDRDAFWRSLFSTSGIFDNSSLRLGLRKVNPVMAAFIYGDAQVPCSEHNED